VDSGVGARYPTWIRIDSQHYETREGQHRSDGGWEHGRKRGGEGWVPDFACWRVKEGWRLQQHDAADPHPRIFRTAQAVQQFVASTVGRPRGKPR
jgi:hypothetical protein